MCVSYILPQVTIELRSSHSNESCFSCQKISFHRCESIGATDLTALVEGMKKHGSLREVCVSHNELADGASLITAINEWLQVCRWMK